MNRALPWQKVYSCVLLGLIAVPSGRAADGLIGEYYQGFSVVSNQIVFDGLTLSKTETNTTFDFWNGSQYYDWNPIGNINYSVHWKGYLHTTEGGQYGLGTISDDGSQIWVDGVLVVDNYEQQWYDWQEGYCWLGIGYHSIEIAFYEAGVYSGIEVWWLKPSAGESVLPYSGETFHTVPPTYDSATKWEILSAPAVVTEAPFTNPKVTFSYLPDISEVTLAWPSSTNASYTIESSEDLLVWQDAAGPWTGTGDLMTRSLVVGKPKMFFRLRLF